MSTAVKVKANRRNAQESTGPTTEDGKAIVAANAVRHGLLSWKPVVAGFENEQEWDTHYHRSLTDLRPEGHLETVLAERVALLLWRLGRVARFELEAITTGLEDAEGAWNRRNARSQSPLKKLSKEVERSRLQLKLLKQLQNAPDEQRLDAELVANLIDAAAKAMEVEIYSDGERKPDVSFPDFPEGAPLDAVDWTAERARAALTAIAQAVERTMPELLIEFIDAVQKELNSKLKEYDAHRADLDRFRRRMLLADEPTMERVRRYETTLERAMLRCLHELQRLQASRQGQAVPVPIALDVNVSTAED